jgi:hypothetical protein
LIITAEQISSHRILIITGHFGTGKTEFSVNLAMDLARAGQKVMLADLDIVNPYFRSRERKALMEEAGVQVICSSQACSDADIPALPAEILTILEDRSRRGILDIGGDPDGARVLARFQPKIVAEDYQLIFVSNANRPEVETAEKSISYLRSIEAVTGTHLHGTGGQHPPVRRDHTGGSPPGFRSGGGNLPSNRSAGSVQHGRKANCGSAG